MLAPFILSKYFHSEIKKNENTLPRITLYTDF